MIKDADYSWGGFMPENIKRAIIKDCLESGDPVNYWMCLLDVISEIADEIPPHGEHEYWENVEWPE
jgi:hypothetical protein